MSQKNFEPNFDSNREPLEQAEAVALIENVIEKNQNNTYQEGGLIDLREKLEPAKEIIFVGDLHGRIDNLLKILATDDNLKKLKDGKIIFVSLGDAIHNEPQKRHIDEEEVERLTNMESSVRIIQLVMELKSCFPNHFYYLLGNHDYLSIKYTKCGVMQGWEFHNHIKKLYGETYVDLYRKFIATSPVLLVGNGVVANHAGPIDSKFKLEGLRQPNVAGDEEDEMIEQLEWRRWRHRDSQLGYQESHVKKFLKKVIEQPKALYLVGHSPHLLRKDNYRVNSFVAKMMTNHYMIYGANAQTGFARFYHGDEADTVKFIDASSSEAKP